jgi:hypothetical protein
VLSYFTAETSFLRAFGNRSLLLIVLCCLTRTGEVIGKASVPGLTLDINPSVIVIFGPVLALLLLISLKAEADTLLAAREVVLDEASKVRQRPIGLWVYLLFTVPALSCAFMFLQFILKLTPKDRCGDWGWINQLTAFSYWQGTPSSHCIGKGSEGPWIYPPLQSFLYLGCVVVSGYLTYQLFKDWGKARGGLGGTATAAAKIS